MSSPDSDDRQNMGISPTFPPPISPKDEAAARRGRLREKPDRVQLPEGNKMKTTQAYVHLSSPQKDPLGKEITSNLELSPSVSPSGDIWKNTQSKSDTGASACLAFPRDKFPSRARNTPESQRSDSEDNKVQREPTLIHKKSGKIVPSALRASSRMRRHSSLHETPICPKAVHFQENGLEHIRLFLRGERPTAVSDSSSPVTSHQNESYFQLDNNGRRSLSPPFIWEMLLNHFPPQCFERTLLPVRVENIYLSSDTKVLIGVVAVSNLAFHKSVVIRFTLDHWKTTSEVVAEFDQDSVESQTKDDCDRFVFKIKLEDQTHLEEKTMFFCVRYNVNLQEYWDNNNLINYQVNFSKRTGFLNGKPCMQAKKAYVPKALPRRKVSPTSSSSFRSTIPSDDSVSLDWLPSSPQPSAMIDASPISLNKRPCAKEITPHAPGCRTDSENRHALANRYDFDTSLAVAIQAGHAAASDRSRVRLEKYVTPVSERRVSSQNELCERPRVTQIQSLVDAGIPITNSKANQPIIPERPESIAMTVKNPLLRSPAYSDLLDKYCFVSFEHEKVPRR